MGAGSRQLLRVLITGGEHHGFSCLSSRLAESASRRPAGCPRPRQDAGLRRPRGGLPAPVCEDRPHPGRGGREGRPRRPRPVGPAYGGKDGPVRGILALRSGDGGFRERVVGVPPLTPQRQRRIDEAQRRIDSRGPSPSLTDAPDVTYLELSWELFTTAIELVDDRRYAWTEAERGGLFGEFRNWIYDLALGAAATLGSSDNPRSVLLAVADELFGRRGCRVVGDDARLPWGEHRLTPLMTRRNRAGARSLALVLLAVAEAVRPALSFHFMLLPGAAAVLHRDRDHEVIVLLAANEKVREWSRRDLRRVFGVSAAAETRGVYLRALDRGEIIGLYSIDMGRRALSLGLSERALELLTRSTELQRSWPGAELELAHLAHKSGNLEAALQHVGRALEIAPLYPAATEARAGYHFERGDLKSARRDYRTLLGLHPDRKSVLECRLGDLARAEERWGEAVEHYRRALEGEVETATQERLSLTIRDLELVPELDALGGGDYARKFFAIRRIVRHPNAVAVEALIGALDDTNLRFARVAWRSLRRVTGQRFGFVREPWSQWWTRRGREEWSSGTPREEYTPGP